MNLFKSLLFLERETTERRLPDAEFAPHYGNRLATERRFRDVFAQSGFARSDAPLACCATTGGS